MEFRGPNYSLKQDFQTDYRAYTINVGETVKVNSFIPGCTFAGTGAKKILGLLHEISEEELVLGVIDFQIVMDASLPLKSLWIGGFDFF
jgi:coenzyme F420-reducing hydrogenase gamma subunit